MIFPPIVAEARALTLPMARERIAAASRARRAIRAPAAHNRTHKPSGASDNVTHHVCSPISLIQFDAPKT